MRMPSHATPYRTAPHRTAALRHATALTPARLLQGGETLIVPDDTIREAYSFTRAELGVKVCHTGAAGFAGAALLY